MEEDQKASATGNALSPSTDNPSFSLTSDPQLMRYSSRLTDERCAALSLQAFVFITATFCMTASDRGGVFGSKLCLISSC